MAIELYFTEKCKNCTCADLEIETLVRETFNGDTVKEHYIRCIHEDACYRIENLTLREEIK